MLTTISGSYPKKKPVPVVGDCRLYDLSTAVNPTPGELGDKSRLECGSGSDPELRPKMRYLVA